MHSLETGIIVSIAMFFFFSFLSFTFLRERNISSEISLFYESEKKEYSIDGERKYKPEVVNNVISIFMEGKKDVNGEE